MASDIKTKHLGDAYRQKIQTSMLINRLQTNAESEQEVMTSGQIKSAEILLRKSLPDLTAIQHQDEDGKAVNPIFIFNATKPTDA